MTKLEKLPSIIENSREVGVKLSKDFLQYNHGYGSPVHFDRTRCAGADEWHLKSDGR